MPNGKIKNNYKNGEIPLLKKTWSKIVRGPLWDGEKKQKKRGVYRVNLCVFYHPSRGTKRGASMYPHYKQSTDQPSKVASLARGQLNRES